MRKRGRESETRDNEGQDRQTSRSRPVTACRHAGHAALACSQPLSARKLCDGGARMRAAERRAASDRPRAGGGGEYKLITCRRFGGPRRLARLRRRCCARGSSGAAASAAALAATAAAACTGEAGAARRGRGRREPEDVGLGEEPADAEEEGADVVRG